MNQDILSSPRSEQRQTKGPDSVLTLGFLLIISVIILLAGLSLYRSTQFNQQLELVVNSYYFRTSLVRNMRISARERIAHLYAASLSNDPFERQERIEALYARGSDFLQTRETLLREDLLPAEIAFIDRHRELAAQFAPDQTRVIELLEQDRLEEARIYLYQTAAPNQAKALSVLDEYFDYLDTLTQEAVSRVRRTAKNSFTMLAGLAAGGILASLLIAYLVQRRLRELFSEVSAARDNLAVKVAERTRELETANSNLDKLANYDVLTDLPNRRFFYDSLDAFLSRADRHHHLVAILYIDLDGFKSVNDELGHEYGDNLLRQVAMRLKNCMRLEDMVARLGGDEFVVVLGDLSELGAIHNIARKVIVEIAKPLNLKGRNVKVGASIGCAAYPVHASDIDNLIAAADKSLYEVKRSGKNNYRIFTE